MQLDQEKQLINPGSSFINLNRLNQISNSIVKIKNESKSLTGTGFFVKIKLKNGYFRALITSSENLESSRFIRIVRTTGTVNKIRELSMIEGKVFSFHKIPELKDIVVIGIKKGEFPDIDFLDIAPDYKNPETYINKEVYILLFPLKGEMNFTFGMVTEITKKSKFIFTHSCDTVVGSSGAPVLLAPSLEVIGIHQKVAPKESNKNFGLFIGCLIEQLRPRKDYLVDDVKRNINVVTITNPEIIGKNDPEGENKNKLSFEKGINDAYSNSLNDNTFTVFTSLKKENLIIYGKKDKSIECFNMDKNKVIKNIPKVFRRYVSTIRHFIDQINSKDLIIVSSLWQRCLKVFNITDDWNCIINKDNAHSQGKMISTMMYYNSFLKENFFVTSWNKKEEFIEIWNMDGTLKENIEDSNKEGTFFIDTFIDRDDKIYIIAGKERNSKSFLFTSEGKFKLYKTYDDSESRFQHDSCIIWYNESDKVTKLIESSQDKSIFIWNFHTAKQLAKIDLNTWPYGICLYRQNYLFISGGDGEIKIIDIKNKNIEAFSIEAHKSVCSIKYLHIDNKGDFLLSEGWNTERGGINIWKINEKYFYI